MMETKHSKHTNQVRICGGVLCGRKLTFNNAPSLRPTPEMVREKLFNWLGQDLTGQNVLDLFSGSGALGFEAASRHAKQVWMCDNHRPSVQLLQQHVKQFNLTDNVYITCQDAFTYLNHHTETFDLVLLDPPFMWQEWATLFKLLKNKLNPNAFVYLEAGKLPVLPEWLNVYRQGKAGKSQFILANYTD